MFLERSHMLTIINPRISTTTSFDNTMKEEILNKSSSLREAISTRNVIRIRPQRPSVKPNVCKYDAVSLVNAVG